MMALLYDKIWSVAKKPAANAPSLVANPERLLNPDSTFFCSAAVFLSTCDIFVARALMLAEASCDAMTSIRMIFSTTCCSATWPPYARMFTRRVAPLRPICTDTDGTRSSLLCLPHDRAGGKLTQLSLMNRPAKARLPRMMRRTICPAPSTVPGRWARKWLRRAAASGPARFASLRSVRSENGRKRGAYLLPYTKRDRPDARLVTCFSCRTALRPIGLQYSLRP